MTPTDYTGFWEVVTDHGRAPCWFPDRVDWSRHQGETPGRIEGLKRCGGGIIVDACHLYPKSKLVVEGYPAVVVYDPRCGVPGCRWHHGLFDSGRIKVLRKRLPAAFEEWAKHNDLEDAVDLRYGERLGV